MLDEFFSKDGEVDAVIELVHVPGHQRAMVSFGVAVLNLQGSEHCRLKRGAPRERRVIQAAVCRIPPPEFSAVGFHEATVEGAHDGDDSRSSRLLAEQAKEVNQLLQREREVLDCALEQEAKLVQGNVG